MNQPLNQPESADDRIEPIDFRSRGGYRAYWNPGFIRSFTGIAAALILFLLGGGAWFVFTARQVTIQIDPPPDKTAISGGLATPRVGKHFLLRPGGYDLTASKTCYRQLDRHFSVGSAKTQQIELAMEKLPGKLEITTHQAGQPQQEIVGARIGIDGTQIGTSPLAAYDIPAGDHRIEISARNYKPLRRDISVEGCEKLQRIDLALVPGWSDIIISSIPSGAIIEIDGKAAGKTPAQLDLTEGAYDLALKAAGHKPWRRRIEVIANQPQKLEDIALMPADGKLTIKTTPAGAGVRIGRRTFGRTPLTVALPPDKNHTITVSKQGFVPEKRSVLLKRAQSQSLQITLAAQNDTVRTDGSPQDDAMLNSIKAPNGYPLKRIPPAAFTMGSSRREQGRRSNETLRAIRLTRSFYIGTREVTNREFRQFLASHRSGQHQGQSLDKDDHPVVSISWEQAARFCNWLSSKASLPPVYADRGGRLTAVDPIGPGYRLPTEAEWALAARFTGEQAATGIKFPWGKGYPPPEGSGNYADASAKDMMIPYMETYNDGYPVTAPPGKFKMNPAGLHDMSGNVAEWCHDFYQIFRPGLKFSDPTGPAGGRHHVVRGSSWKHGSISTLRISYRDYNDSKRSDLGFRVARYVK